MTASRVEVVVHLPVVARVIRPAQLLVQVEDAGEADAPAVVVSRLVLDIPGIDLSSAGPLRFEVPYNPTGSDLTVSARLAADTSRAPKPGDLVQPATVRVVPGQPAHVHLVVYEGA